MSFRYVGAPRLPLIPLAEIAEEENLTATLSTVVAQLVGLIDDVLPTADDRPPAAEMAPAYGTAVPVLTKAEEDKLLRPPYDGEVVCLSGVHCECMQMARFPPHERPDEGFHGVAVHHGYCLLCLRVATSKSFYTSSMTDCGGTQLLRNRIEHPGEYARGACFLPCGTNSFLTDPVVMHQRNVSVCFRLPSTLHCRCLTPFSFSSQNYRYTDGRIVQLSCVNFRQPRSDFP